MSEILLANLFFIITGSAVLVVGAFLCVVCYHLIRFTRKARAILDRAEIGAEALVSDVKALRDHITHGSALGRITAALIGALVTGKKKRPSSRRKKETDVDSINGAYPRNSIH